MANDKNQKTSWGKQVSLIPKANPLEYQTLAHEEVETLRCLGCSAYSSCLDWACSQGWESFICVLCPFYKDGGINPAMPCNPLFNDPEEMI